MDWVGPDSVPLIPASVPRSTPEQHNSTGHSVATRSSGGSRDGEGGREEGRDGEREGGKGQKDGMVYSKSF
jgi:hypothetical protein